MIANGNLFGFLLLQLLDYTLMMITISNSSSFSNTIGVTIGSDSISISSISSSGNALPATGKDLVKVVFRPPDIWRQTGKLPLAPDLAIPVLVGAVGVTLDRHRRERLVRVLLVRYPQLVPAHDLGRRHHLPSGRAAKVLRLERWVAEHGGRRDHADEFGRGHGGPGFGQEGSVVDMEGGGDDLG